jgi:hypothetical protein
MFARVALIRAQDLRVFECPECDRSQQDIARLDFHVHCAVAAGAPLEGLW